MSSPSRLRERVLARLYEVFGEPDHSLGRDDHWALFPAPRRPTINIVVDGTAEGPAVWVFDPYLADDNVLRKFITNDDELDDIIEQIQDRMEQAAIAPPRPRTMSDATPHQAGRRAAHWRAS